MKQISAEKLLAAGAKPNTADEYGETPLTLACANGDAMLVGNSWPRAPTRTPPAGTARQR